MIIPQGSPYIPGYHTVAVTYENGFFVFYLKGKSFYAVAKWDGVSEDFQEKKIYPNLLTSDS